MQHKATAVNIKFPCWCLHIRTSQTEVGSNKVHLLHYIYMSKCFWVKSKYKSGSIYFNFTTLVMVVSLLHFNAIHVKKAQFLFFSWAMPHSRINPYFEMILFKALIKHVGKMVWIGSWICLNDLFIYTQLKPNLQMLLFVCVEDLVEHLRWTIPQVCIRFPSIEVILWSSGY